MEENMTTRRAETTVAPRSNSRSANGSSMSGGSGSVRRLGGRGHVRYNSEPQVEYISYNRDDNAAADDGGDVDTSLHQYETGGSSSGDRRQLLASHHSLSMNNLNNGSNHGHGSRTSMPVAPAVRPYEAFDFAQLTQNWATPASSGDGNDFFQNFLAPVDPVVPTMPSSMSLLDRVSSTASAASTQRPDGMHMRNRTMSSSPKVGVVAAMGAGADLAEEGIITPSLATDDIPSVIHDAARITNWDQVLALCDSLPEAAAYKGRDGWTALHHACNRRCPYAHVVKALLEAYPDAVLQRCEKGWLPIHYACRFKAPTEVVRLLLHLYPEKGTSTVSQVDRLGRTPLYYAIRYDAPPGVVGLLLQVDPSAVLEEDQNEDSPLALVWDSWAEKLEGKRIVNSFLPGGFPEPKDVTVEERAKILRDRLARSSKLLKRWRKVNILLKAAFGFPVEEDEDDEYNLSTGNESDGESEKSQKCTRKWRIVHATAAVKCHLSLFLLACALHPEQTRELDEGDLQRPGDPTSNTAHQTALHLAASSNAGGEHGKTVLLTLLRDYRDASEMPDGIDGSLPLHRMVENPRKQDWSNHAAILYRFYPRAVQIQDSNGMLPLHRAAAGIPHGIHKQRLYNEDSSVIVQLTRAYPQAATHLDHFGCYPFHYIVGNAEDWDSGLENVYNFHRNAIQVRAGPSYHNRLPLHMAAASVHSGQSLLSRMIQHHPRAASLTDRQGKLPLHLACEVGKHWSKGTQVILEAFPPAISVREENDRGWYPLHMAAASPEADAELIQKLIEANVDAAGIPDRNGQYPIHLACKSGKSWDNGIRALFEADANPMSVADSKGLLPFHLAAFRYCAADYVPVEDTIEDSSPKVREAKRAAEASTVDIFFNLLRADPTVLASVPQDYGMESE